MVMAEPTASENNTWPDIPEFFSGKTVFITGATGFVGKVLLEKLLRSCTEIEEIFLLIRPPLGGSAKDRLDRLLNSQIFDRIREERPDLLEKLVPISGDILRYNLELDDAEMQLVCQNVSIVFHAAASVKFDELPKRSLNSNLLGTKNLLDVCHQMKNLVAFVYVSTAYSFCNVPEIMEYLYPEKFQPSQILSMLEWLPGDLMEKVMKIVNPERPYVYHYSKAMAEIYLSEYRGRIPVSVVRPSMVTATWREPFPGWIDSRAGPSGMIAACSKGVIRSVFVNPNQVADLVPVDIVVNTIIAAARETAFRKRKRMLIVNCTALPDNYITWHEVEKICYPLIIKYPSENLFRHPGGSFKDSHLMHAISILKSHLLPAYLFDFAAYPFVEHPVMVEIYSRVHRLLGQFEYFTTTKFTFQTENRRKLYGQMSPEDKARFPMVMNGFLWSDYMDNYVLGIRRYVLREKDETLPRARSKMVRTYYVWLMLKYTPVVLGLWYICKQTDVTSWRGVSRLRSLLPKLLLPKAF